MRKLIFVVALVLTLSLTILAQDKPKIEVFGGYSYLREDGDDDGIDLHGWNASGLRSLNKWFGLKADFSGYYRDVAVAPSVRSDLSTHLFLFGPQFTLRKHEVLQPFGHVLLGAKRVNVTTTFVGGTIKSSDTAFAMAIGGGLDAQVHKNVAIRLFQTDYVLSRFNDKSQHNFRVSTGLVLRLGEQ